MTVLSKRDRVVFLLDHWCDFFETLHQAELGAGDDESAVTLMPRMSRHPSVVELGRAIGMSRRLIPFPTAHMMCFYTAEWRNVTRVQKKRTKKGKIELVQVRMRERVVPSWVRMDYVNIATAVTTDSFRGEVFIPSELMEAAA